MFLYFSPEKLNILHDRNYAGYTHEFVTDQWARNRGEEVIIPETFNQKGYDRIYNGEKFQIKFNSVDAIEEHRIKYPDIKVRTDIETAEAYREKFPEDVAMVFGTTPKVLTTDIISEGKLASMEVFENEELFETGVPEVLGIAAIIPLVKNVSYINTNQTKFETEQEMLQLILQVEELNACWRSYRFNFWTNRYGYRCHRRRFIWQRVFRCL